MRNKGQSRVDVVKSQDTGCVKLSIMNSSRVSKFQLTVFLVAEQKYKINCL